MLRNQTRFAAVLAIVLMPHLLQAQSVKSSANDSGYDQAKSLRAQAIALYDDPSRAADIARLHLQELRHRAANDPEAIHALFLAAFFFKTAGRLGDATKAYEQAAERVLSAGDVMASAQAYLDAAFVAEQAGKPKATRRLATKALLLSDSPLLRADQQRWIRHQIQSTPALAAAVK
jgi:tetratricopeptide (TPR) repeat protein